MQDYLLKTYICFPKLSKSKYIIRDNKDILYSPFSIVKYAWINIKIRSISYDFKSHSTISNFGIDTYKAFIYLNYIFINRLLCKYFEKTALLYIRSNFNYFEMIFMLKCNITITKICLIIVYHVFSERCLIKIKLFGLH